MHLEFSEQPHKKQQQKMKKTITNYVPQKDSSITELNVKTRTLN